MEFVDIIASKIVDLLVEPVGRELGYLIFYKSNVESLAEETAKLKDKRAGIQLQMDAATRKSEVILPEVIKWVEEVDKVTNELERFLEEEENANKMCLNGWFPNLTLQHNLGRKAKKNNDVVSKLQQEAKFDKISCPAPPTGTHLGTSTKAFESRTQILKQVMEALRDRSMHIIAICGMGGIGKTTMAKEVARRAKEENLFDMVAMAVVSQNPNVNKIQGEIADALDLKFNRETESGRAGELRSHLKSITGKILVILDDIWKRLDLEMVGIPYGGEHSRCTVLLTSRDLEVVNNQMRSQRTFTIGVLSEDEAWNLFEEATGTSINAPELRPIAKQIANECRGLPVAIVTLGRALENRGKLEWEDALGKLRKSTAHTISQDIDAYSSIELSYNFLNDEEAKSCFLLCCIFPEDHDIPIETLVRYGKGLRLFQQTETMEEARRRTHSLVQTLKRCFLLLNSDETECVKLHDVVRDVAVSIASRKEHGFVVRCDDKTEEWPIIDRGEDCTTISLVTEEIKKRLDTLRCPNLKLLNLSAKILYRQGLNENFCEEMKELKVLALQNVHIQSLPSSLHVLQNLEALLLEDCVLQDISSIGALVKGEVVSLYGSEIQELPTAIRKLQRLKLLDMTDCRNLKRIPPGVLTSLTRLEELYIGDSFRGLNPPPAQGDQDDQKTCASLDEISALSNHLKVLYVGVPKVDLLPRNFFFNNLTRFRISVGSAFGAKRFSFENYLSYSGDTDALRKSGLHLLLNNCETLKLEGRIGRFTRLHEVGFSRLKVFRLLGVEGVEYLMDISSNWNGSGGQVPFPLLEILQLTRVGLKGICHPDLLQARQREINDINPPPTQESMLFRNLKHLTLRGVDEMTYVFSTYLARGSLPQLQTMDLQYCIKMEGIVYKEAWENDNDIADDMVVFPALTRLSLITPYCLSSLYCGNNNTNRTPQAALVDKEIQESSSQSAFTLIPYKCIKWLPSLVKLELSECHPVRVVCDFRGLVMPLPSKEKKNSELVAAAHEVEETEVDHFDGTDQQRHCCLKCLPAPPPARSLKGRSKTSTSTSSCSDAPTAQALRSAARDDGLQQQQLLQSLRYIHVSWGRSVAVIFDFGESQGLFPPVLINLSEMNLIRLPELTHIWNIKKGPQQLVFGFQNLRMLRVERCMKLTNMFSPSIAKLLVMLEEIYVEGCESMQVIVQKEEEMNVNKDVTILLFSHLRSISLGDLPHLSCFCDQPNCGFRFPSLETIQIRGCPELETFVKTSAASAEDVVTPKLKQVEDRDLPPTDSNNWRGNLNATIQNNFQLKSCRQGSRKKETSERLEELTSD